MDIKWQLAYNKLEKIRDIGRIPDNKEYESV